MKKYDISEIAILCKMLRIKNGVKQREIADDLGCTVSAVSYFEAGCTNNAEYLFYYLNRFGLLEFTTDSESVCLTDAEIESVYDQLKSLYGGDLNGETKSV